MKRIVWLLSLWAAVAMSRHRHVGFLVPLLSVSTGWSTCSSSVHRETPSSRALGWFAGSDWLRAGLSEVLSVCSHAPRERSRRRRG